MNMLKPERLDNLSNTTQLNHTLHCLETNLWAQLTSFPCFWSQQGDLDFFLDLRQVWDTALKWVSQLWEWCDFSRHGMKIFSTTKDMGDAWEGNKKGLEKMFTVVSSQPSVSQEFTCNAGDTGSIPRSGRSAGEGIGSPLQYSWTSLVAQLVKNPPAMWDTWAQSLGWEDPLEKGKATLSRILAWKFHVHGVAKSRTQLSDLHFHFQVNPLGYVYETTDIPEAWTQIQSCFSLSIILRWKLYCLLMTCWALFPVILFVCDFGGSFPAFCLSCFWGIRCFQGILPFDPRCNFTYTQKILSSTQPTFILY